ncbi:1-phosphofructokinase [Bacillus sp. V59.32b]|uniref:1-phosphofructokinase n=1 Tax=Bacillus sp. V59.32b TaxID=1758642 RepID=UPI000E3DB35F|nr:1-phosphofructokinase [Bacillus sp. V59.32b]RFU68267.1 1-phosphofructokinase [Bacillus sp. V59.32b]
MIYTVTLNPAIDFIVEVDDFQSNSLNRIKKEAKFPGGKGINVSRVLKRIGIESKALGFTGGFTGEFIKNFLETENISVDFTEVATDTRINIKLKSAGETEINGLGPEVTQENYQDLLKKINELTIDDIVVLAGSIPPSVPSDFYEHVTKLCLDQGIRVIVDTSGPSLMDVIKHKPFLVKPNHHELGEIFSTKIQTTKDAAKYGQQLIELGARNVIVSMAGEGAVLCTENKMYSANVPSGKVVNSVGAGDSVVAGFVGTYTKTADILKAFKFGLAAGSATAFSADLARKEDIEALIPQIEVKELVEGIL